MQGEPRTTPLTHHEILERVAPFTRAGQRLDLARSDRLARHLVFKPVDRGDRMPGLVDALALTLPVGGRALLVRTLTQASGLQATLSASSPDVASLLALIEAADPVRQFIDGPGYCIALNHRLSDGAEPRLMGAVIRLQGLTLEMSVSVVKGIPAALTLRAVGPTEVTSGASVVRSLPQDLLAVLGLRWSRLTATKDGWTATVGLRGGGTERSRDAVRRLQTAAAHLARTLASPPAAFHDRHRLARIGVMLRRAVPLAACVGVIGAALAVPALDLAQDSVLRMLIFNAPPLLLAAFFAFREMPRVELPPLPRQIAADAWEPVTESPSPTLR